GASPQSWIRPTPWRSSDAKSEYDRGMLDLRLAFRNLLARPGFSIVALLTLALGIGANTAVFTVVDAVLLSPLPYSRPDRIVILNETSPQLPNVSVTRY